MDIYSVVLLIHFNRQKMIVRFFPDRIRMSFRKKMGNDHTLTKLIFVQTR